MPKRHASVDGYRYGFQGQERDDEVKDIPGGSINYKFRMHDPRVGRFFAVDPLVHDYPWNSPYAFSENRVIDMIELEGLEAASTEDKDNAVDQVDEFVKNKNIKSSAYFKNITKEEFANSLYDLINNPDRNMQCTNTCGISAIAGQGSFDFYPQDITKTLIDLYVNGSGKLGDIELDSENLGSLEPDNGQNAADVILATTLRNSLNVVTSYNPKTDEGFDGFTWPRDISLLAKNMGFTDISGGYFSGLDVKKADEYINKHGLVIILYDTKKIQDESTSQYWHYMQYRGGYKENKDGSKSMKVWDYGEEKDFTYKNENGIKAVWYIYY